MAMYVSFSYKSMVTDCSFPMKGEEDRKEGDSTVRQSPDFLRVGAQPSGGALSDTQLGMRDHGKEEQEEGGHSKGEGAGFLDTEKRKSTLEHK